MCIPGIQITMHVHTRGYRHRSSSACAADDELATYYLCGYFLRKYILIY